MRSYKIETLVFKATLFRVHILQLSSPWVDVCIQDAGTLTLGGFLNGSRAMTQDA
jgi:hypothetical protein